MRIGLYSITYRGVWYRGDAVDVFNLVRLAKEHGFEGLERELRPLQSRAGPA